MQQDGHEKKVKRLEATLEKLSDAADYETIIELCYAAAVQYIALVCAKRLKNHQDTHKGLSSFLERNGLSDLAEMLRRLELFRTSRYYGARGNGTAAKEAKRTLEDIKARLH